MSDDNAPAEGLRKIVEAAIDVDQLWFGDEGELIQWDVEAPQALEDLRSAIIDMGQTPAPAEGLAVVRRLLGYLWMSSGTDPDLLVADLFDADDPIRADVERLAIFPEGLDVEDAPPNIVPEGWDSNAGYVSPLAAPAEGLRTTCSTCGALVNRLHAAAIEAVQASVHDGSTVAQMPPAPAEGLREWLAKQGDYRDSRDGVPDAYPEGWNDALNLVSDWLDTHQPPAPAEGLDVERLARALIQSGLYIDAEDPLVGLEPPKDLAGAIAREYAKP